METVVPLVSPLVTPVVTDAGENIYKYFKRTFGYIKNLDSNFEKLELEAVHLSTRESDVRAQIQRNEGLMEHTQECGSWLEAVKKNSEDVEDVKNRYVKVKAASSSCGLCHQLHTRWKLGKEIVKLTDSVIGLRNHLKHDHILFRERPPERVEKKFLKKIDVPSLPTIHQHVEKILKHLKDDKMKIVGIHGMPGVGKTTILEILNDEVEKHKEFEIVIWVTVSKEEDLCQIQQQILKRLGVKVEGRDAATLIRKSLEKKKFLLLLDEVYSKIDLSAIGIPKDMPGKVVVAAREKKICNSMMTDEEIKVERLSRDDARKLFREVVGEAFDHPGIRPIAEKVLKQCGELPQLIKVVGKHLKGNFSEDIWRNTLSSFQCETMSPLENMEEVLKIFNLICEKLEGCPKECLLYGASFHEDYEIYDDYLVECWKAQQLIGINGINGINRTLREACEQGHTYLQCLIDRSLFDRCKNSKFVKMPVIFRNTVLRMANHQNFGLLVADKKSHPPVEKWEDAKVVSLVNSDLKELPDNPKCNRVSILFLQKNEMLINIPSLFFISMSTLKILDLCRTSIKYLPPSVSELTALRGLYLNDCCQLLQLPEEIKKLLELEILDIRRTGIRYFPEVIKYLTCLQCLRVSFATTNSSDQNTQNHVRCNGVDETPSKIFESLLQLEELAIEVNPKNDPIWNKIAPEIVVQLAKLGKLSALSFCFPTTESLETFTGDISSWENFRSFNLYVGSRESCKSYNLLQFDVPKLSSQRFLQYSDGEDTPSVIKGVLKATTVFKLINHPNIINFSDFGIDTIERLEVCELEACNEMIAVLEANNMAETKAFKWLQELHLLNLPKLKHICHGRIASDSFARLTTLILHSCPNLSRVLSWEMTKQLTELHHLRVEECTQVTEIFEIDSASESDSSGALPKLKILELVNLQALVKFHNSNSFDWKALREIQIDRCAKLIDIGLNDMNAGKLHCIKCSEAWWIALPLNDEIRAHLQTFCYFVVQN